MKTFLLCVQVLFLTCCAAVSAADFPGTEGEYQDVLPAPPEGMEWKLIWHDEFNGNQIDWSKWDAPEWNRRDGFWSPGALALDGNGNLVMSVCKDSDGRFIDCCLRSCGKFEKAKGYFTARMKLHNETGHWSAFWLMNKCEGNIGNGSADGAEIDIVETPWLADKINCAVHWDGYGEEHRTVHCAPDFEGGRETFHTFGLWWGDDAYRFYIDGRFRWLTGADGICTEPLYLKLSDEIGEWAGDIKQAVLPDQTLVDYVRVYDLAPIQK